jgi:hypothetical protein
MAGRDDNLKFWSSGLRNTSPATYKKDSIQKRRICHLFCTRKLASYLAKPRTINQIGWLHDDASTWKQKKAHMCSNAMRSPVRFGFPFALRRSCKKATAVSLRLTTDRFRLHRFLLAVFRPTFRCEIAWLFLFLIGQENSIHDADAS